MFVSILSITGCGGFSPNPAFNISHQLLQIETQRMREQPIELERPLVVLAGYRSPMKQAKGLSKRLINLTSGQIDDALPLAYPHRLIIPDIAATVVERVQRRWPSDDPNWTVEVDVVGVSMGGLVARVASHEPAPGKLPRKRLRIRRLFTIGTPHQGAKLAAIIAFDRAARDMKPGSAFLTSLNAQRDDEHYEIIPYARTRDQMVGATNTAPPDLKPFWTPGPIFLSHWTISHDRRIALDIARRLRGEWPLAIHGSTPPSD